MPMLLQRKAVVPIWILVFGMLAAFGPVASDLRIFFLFVALVVPTIVVFLWREPPQTVAEVLRQVDSSHIER